MSELVESTDPVEVIGSMTTDIVDQKQLAERLLERAKEQNVELVGPGGLLGRLTKSVLETALDAEMAWALDHRLRQQHTRVGCRCWDRARYRGLRRGVDSRWEWATVAGGTTRQPRRREQLCGAAPGGGVTHSCSSLLLVLSTSDHCTDAVEFQAPDCETIRIHQDNRRTS